MKKKYKTIAIIAFFIALFSAFFIRGYFMNKKAEETFKDEKEYSGLIEEIVYVDGNRGLPKINIGTQWIFLSAYVESTVSTYIEVGDSISKSPGENIIKVYRKNKSGQWKERIFN